MVICNCSLAGTAACSRCSQNPSAFKYSNFNNNWFPPYTQGTGGELPHKLTTTNPSIFKSKKTTIEEFDEDGIITKRTVIIEDEGPDETVYIDDDDYDLYDDEGLTHGIN